MALIIDIYGKIMDLTTNCQHIREKYQMDIRDTREKREEGKLSRRYTRKREERKRIMINKETRTGTGVQGAVSECRIEMSCPRNSY